MDLIPVTDQGGEELGPRQIEMSATARKLAGVRTEGVRREAVEVETRLVGKIGVDETRQRYITAWIPGRLDRLYIDYTGISVRAGDHLALLYSPELLTAQEELIQALKGAELAGTGGLGKTAGLTVEAAREKLRLWGLKPEQIAQIERMRKVVERLTIYAPTGGVVVEKHLQEGAYVKTGERIYTIVDLGQVWLELEAYESDLVWIRYGQEVEFEIEAAPGETFSGRIAFISPTVDEKTRTVRVRVNVPNADGRLKPGMFARALVRAQVAASGRVMEPALEGKEGVFEGREIVLGPRAGDRYIVQEGLREGEQVVVNGAFKIDSALQIQAKASMMNPQMEDAATGKGHDSVTAGSGETDAQATHDHGEKDGDVFKVPPGFRAQLGELFAAYLEVQQGLSQDDFGRMAKGAEGFATALAAVDMELLKGEAHAAWMEELKGLQEVGEELAEAGGIEGARAAFEPLSEGMTQVARSFGTGREEAVYRFFCPMAFSSQGAHWLQTAEKTENPYFGGRMYRCGSQEEVFEGDGGGSR